MIPLDWTEIWNEGRIMMITQGSQILARNQWQLQPNKQEFSLRQEAQSLLCHASTAGKTMRWHLNVVYDTTCFSSGFDYPNILKLSKY